MFVVHSDQILLIRKKRGLGAGKINGPGGKREPGETLQQCAHREIHEELCVYVSESDKQGETSFSVYGRLFAGRSRIRGHQI